jgi:hypothetical protein
MKVIIFDHYYLCMNDIVQKYQLILSHLNALLLILFMYSFIYFICKLNNEINNKIVMNLLVYNVLIIHLLILLLRIMVAYLYMNYYIYKLRLTYKFFIIKMIKCQTNIFYDLNYNFIGIIMANFKLLETM